MSDEIRKVLVDSLNLDKPRRLTVEIMLDARESTIQELQSSNTKLREALIRICGIKAPGDKPQGPYDFENIFVIANEALEDGPKEKE